MKLLIDSNRYTDFCLGIEPVVELVSSAEEILMPLIVLAELRAGFANGRAREKNERVLTKFLNNPGVFVLLPNEQTSFFYADLYGYLRGKGRPIPTNDLWIAALCVQFDLVLFDRDAHFDLLPQLARARIASSVD